jgi:hypothetical protein
MLVRTQSVGYLLHLRLAWNKKEALDDLSASWILFIDAGELLRNHLYQHRTHCPSEVAGI